MSDFDFINKIKGSNSISAIIGEKDKLVGVEDELLHGKFLQISKLEDIKELLINNDIFVSLFKCDDKEIVEWYDVALGYASGQIYIADSNIRINAISNKKRIVFLISESQAEKYSKLLEVVGMTLSI